MKPRIHLFGRHSHRTPFSYAPYRVLFESGFDYVADPAHCDFVVAGFNIDFRDNAAEVLRIRDSNPHARFIVFSEEPLWDTVWSGDPTQLDARLPLVAPNREDMLDYKFINHFTTSVFDFEKLPYFITTQDDFFVRYLNLFHRNASLSPAQVSAAWAAAPLDCAFVAARRPSASFDVSLKDGQVLGLNRYRTQIAEELHLPSVHREGTGWGTDQKRQALPDWHLDKLASLDRRCRTLSALENTHVASYVSEKLFDAFAMLAAPIYHALPTHRALALVHPGSFINTAGLSVSQAVARISSFRPDAAFLEAYVETQQQLLALFSNARTLADERHRLVRQTEAMFKRFV